MSIDPAFASSSRRTEWLVPVGLVALPLVHCIAGALRVAGLARGEMVSADDARFFAAPVPVVLHIVNVTIYCMVGALQFAPVLRRRRFD